MESLDAVKTTNMPSQPAVLANDGNFAFLIHSQESLSQQNPPLVDNQRLARQKRKRTSPEDQAVLEAEYQQNPKPDKAARMAIVDRVALGEKEVQIWFQNRRQVTRRKSKPLEPHEIMASLRPAQDPPDGPTSSFSSQPSSSQSMHSSYQGTEESFGAISLPRTASDTSEPPTCTQKSEPSSMDQETRGEQPSWPNGGVNLDTGIQSGNITGGQSKPKMTDTTRCGQLFRSLSQSLPKKQKRALGLNRRSVSFVIHDEEGSYTAADPQPLGLQTEGNRLRSEGVASKSTMRKPSVVRLSMSFEGKAEVTTRTGNTPSPPRATLSNLNHSPPITANGLQRNASSSKSTQGGAGEVDMAAFVGRPANGRSRDARTWEFYCDKEARDALNEQAEREESGSATAAIALIRSNSSNAKAVTAYTNKRVASEYKLEIAKRSKGDEQHKKKPRLARSKSSVANMQTAGHPSLEKGLKDRKTLRKSGSQSAIFDIYEGDSDKENWMPGTQTRDPSRRKPESSIHRRSILEESLRHPRASNSRRSLPSGRSQKATHLDESKENGPPEISEDVAAFMGQAAHTREADDLDCVQNLLSLSQAAW